MVRPIRMLASTEIPPYATWLLPIVMIGVLVQFFWSSIISVLIYRLTKGDRNTEGLEERLHEVTTKLVDERFRSMTHEVRNHVQPLLNVVEEMRARLKEGESGMESLGDRDQRLELALVAKFDVLKDFIRDTTATKKDLDKHQDAMERKLQHVEQQMTSMGQDLAVLKSQGASRKV